MSTFQRKRNIINIPGSRPSLQNGQLIVSSGNPSLDAIFGGGLAIGSILLIEEDKYVTYSKALSRYFLAEGAVYKNDMFVVNLDDDPKRFIKKIPLPTSERGSSSSTSSLSSSVSGSSSSSSPKSKIQMETNETANSVGSNIDDMRIAWRYNALPKVDAEQMVSHVEHHFDLTKLITNEMIEQLNFTFFDGHCSKKHNKTQSPIISKKIFKNSIYLRLLNQLKNKITSMTGPVDNGAGGSGGGGGGGNNTTPSSNQLLRISLSSLGSPKWYENNCPQDLCLFLTILKSLVRNSTTICCITMPLHLLKHLDDRLIPRIRNLVDYCIELESFIGSDKETNPIFKEYHGLIYVHRIVALNTLAASSPETHDLAFKLRRRQFVIEKLHLPPELQENVSNDNVTATETSCGSVGGTNKSLLEF